MIRFFLISAALVLGGCACKPATEGPATRVTILLKGGMVYSGRDELPVVTDVRLSGDRILGIRDAGDLAADLILDVRGLAVAPGRIGNIKALSKVRDRPAGGRQGVGQAVSGAGWEGPGAGH